MRSEKESLFTLGIFSNKPLIGSVLLAFILQFGVTYIPALNPVFHTQPLSLREFIMVGIASSLIFWVVEAKKAISRRKRKRLLKVT